jgi:hypothetical protein
VTGSTENGVSFSRDVAPLFRDEDVTAMEFAFDLRSYDDVVENGDLILERLEDGSMPCDQPWPARDVELFLAWLDGGRAK